MPNNDNEMTLRRLLWLYHGHNESLYGDDGEMQCHRCMLDFKRDSVEKIKTVFEERRWKKMKEFFRNEERRGKNDDTTTEIPA